MVRCQGRAEWEVLPPTGHQGQGQETVLLGARESWSLEEGPPHRGYHRGVMPPLPYQCRTLWRVGTQASLWLPLTSRCCPALDEAETGGQDARVAALRGQPWRPEQDREGGVLGDCT